MRTLTILLSAFFALSLRVINSRCCTARWPVCACVCFCVRYYYYYCYFLLLLTLVTCRLAQLVLLVMACHAAAVEVKIQGLRQWQRHIRRASPRLYRRSIAQNYEVLKIIMRQHFTLGINSNPLRHSRPTVDNHYASARAPLRPPVP